MLDTMLFLEIRVIDEMVMELGEQTAQKDISCGILSHYCDLARGYNLKFMQQTISKNEIKTRTLTLLPVQKRKSSQFTG